MVDLTSRIFSFAESQVISLDQLRNRLGISRQQMSHVLVHIFSNVWWISPVHGSLSQTDGIVVDITLPSKVLNMGVSRYSLQCCARLYHQNTFW